MSIYWFNKITWTISSMICDKKSLCHEEKSNLTLVWNWFFKNMVKSEDVQLINGIQWTPKLVLNILWLNNIIFNWPYYFIRFYCQITCRWSSPCTNIIILFKKIILIEGPNVSVRWHWPSQKSSAARNR